MPCPVLSGSRHRAAFPSLIAVLLVFVASAASSQEAPRVELPPAVYVPYDKAPEAGLAGKGVYLPYEQFVKLWDAAQPKPPDLEHEPPIGAALSGYTLEGAVKGDYALLTLTGSVVALAKGWSKVQLPNDLTITKFSANDPRVALERGDRSITLHLPAAGTYPFTAEVAVAVTRDAAGKRSVALVLPAAPAGRLDLFVPDAAADVTVMPAVAATTQKEKDGTRLLCVLGGARALTVSWQPPVQAIAGESLLLATEDVLATIAERSLRFDAVIGLTVLRRPLADLAITLPPSTQVLAVEGPGLRTWEKVDDRLILHLHEPIEGSYRATVRLERLLPPLPPGESRTLPLLLPLVASAARTTGTLALVTADQGNGIGVSVESHEGLSQVDPAELGVAAAVAAFRFLAPPPALVVTVTRSQPEVRAQVDQLVRLGVEEDVIAVELKLDVRKAGVFAIACDVPAAWELAESSGDPVAIDDSRLGAAADGVRRLDLSLRSRLLGQGSIALRFRAPASIPRTATAADLGALAVLRVRDAREQRGSLLVAAPRGWALATGARDGLAGADPERLRREGPLAVAARELKEDEELPLAFTYVAADPMARLSAHLSATPRPRELSLREEILITVAEGAVRRVVTWRGEVRYSALPALRVQAPTSLDDRLVFKGAGLAERSVVARADGLSTWELRFQAPVLGVFVLTAEQVLPAPALAPGKPAALTIEPVRALDATRIQRVVAVAREGTVEVSATAVGMESLAAADLPTSLQGQGVVAGFQGSEAVPLTLTLTRRDLVALADAAVTAAHYQVVVGEDGVARVRARLLIASRGRPFLELRLPEHGDLLEVAVDRHQGRPSRREDGSVVVPLSEAAVPASQLVAFVYEQRLGAGALGHLGRIALRLPDVGGDALARPLPVERVDVELYLPSTVTALRWSGDLRLREGPLGLWEALVAVLADDHPRDDGVVTGSDDDGLTVQVALTGMRSDLTRLGGGGAISCWYLGSALLRLLALAMALLGGALAVAAARRAPSAAITVALAAAVAALISTGAWRLPGWSFSAGVALVLLATAVASARRRRHAWQATAHAPVDDPWIAPPTAPPAEPSSPASGEPPAEKP